MSQNWDAKEKSMRYFKMKIIGTWWLKILGDEAEGNKFNWHVFAVIIESMLHSFIAVYVAFIHCCPFVRILIIDNEFSLQS